MSTTPHPDTVTQELFEELADTILWDENDEGVISEPYLRELLAEAYKAGTASRVIPAGTPVYIIQDEMGDVIDVTTSREWAEWQTRDDEDAPERVLIEDTLWDGPIDREDWT